MGGAQALYVALNYLERFAAAASFSGAPPMWSTEAIRAISTGAKVDSTLFQRVFPTLGTKANSQPALLWIACGTSDDLLDVNRQFKEWLKSKSVSFIDVETPGGHTFAVWRRNLVDLAPLLFRT